jgi:hypothetical protein
MTNSLHGWHLVLAGRNVWAEPVAVPGGLRGHTDALAEVSSKVYTVNQSVSSHTNERICVSVYTEHESLGGYLHYTYY